MESVKETQKKYCSLAVMAAILIGLVMILAGQKPVGKGLILGTLFSVINFVLMGEILPVKMGKSRQKAFFLSLGSISFRYLLMAIPLFLAIKMEQFNLIASICGLFMVQLMILVDHFIVSIFSSYKKQI
ncbi:MAG: ATP synthase subunit I [Desulfobacterales bacterium]|nr:MAG: ATP synthase subunit I [Desulfobacterales bacterium]